MRKLMIVIALFLFSGTAFSQIVHQKTLTETFAKAKAEGKPVFICIMPSKFIYRTWFMCGLKKKEVATYYNKTFINYLGFETNKDTMAEISKYPLLKGSPHNLYLDSGARLVYQSFGIYTDVKTYLTFADSAMQKIPQRIN